MKKIVFINHETALGGGTLCLYRIIMELKNEYEISIILPNKNGELVRLLQKLEINIIVVPKISPLPLRQKHIIKILYGIFLCIRTSSSIRPLIKRINPDIVYANSLVILYLLVNIKNKGYKTIIHIRENWKMNDNKLWYKIIRNLIPRIDLVFTINKSTYSLYKDHKNIHIIYDWIEMDNVTESKIQSTNLRDTKYFIFFGGDTKTKGTLEVLEAFCHIDNPKDYQLLIIGDSLFNSNNINESTAISNLLKIENLKERSIFNHIRFIPKTFGIAHLLKEAFCLIAFPTFNHAILPIIEAAYFNVPVICKSYEESIEYTGFGLNALLVSNSTTNLKEAIEFAINNPQKMKDLGENGQFLTSHFHKQPNILKLKSTIHILLNKKK